MEGQQNSEGLQMQYMLMSQELRNVQFNLQQLQHASRQHQAEVSKQMSQLKREEEQEREKVEDMKKNLEQDKKKCYDKNKEMVIIALKYSFYNLSLEYRDKKISAATGGSSQKGYNDKHTKEHNHLQQMKQKAYNDLLKTKTDLTLFEQEFAAARLEFENSSLRASMNQQAEAQLKTNKVNYKELTVRLNQFITRFNNQINTITKDITAKHKTCADVQYCVKQLQTRLQALERDRDALGVGINEAKLVKEVECGVCCDNFDPDEIYFSPCGHYSYCRSCMHDWLKAKINDINIFNLSCPVNKQCPDKLPRDISQLYLEGEEAEKFDKMMIQEEIKDKQCFCPRCGEQYEEPPPGAEPNVACVNPKCTLSFCVNCKSTWHADETCEQYQRRPEEERSADARAFLEFAAKEGWKRCPQCAVILNKYEGCAYVVCGMCKGAMCWNTGKLRKDCGGGHNCH